MPPLHSPSGNDIDDPLWHHDDLFDRAAFYSTLYTYQFQRRRFYIGLRRVALYRQLIPPLTIYLYGNGDGIVNEQSFFYAWPGLFCQKTVVTKSRPALLSQMRHEGRKALRQQFGGFPYRPIKTGIFGGFLAL
jgi:hypothetical protein